MFLLEHFLLEIMFFRTFHHFGSFQLEMSQKPGCKKYVAFFTIFEYFIMTKKQGKKIKK